MKCYICLTAPQSENDVYVDLLEVTLKSAKLNTSLEMVALYDGPENHRCHKLMEHYGVKIINHTFSRKQDLEKTFPKDYLMKVHGRLIPYDKMAGTFMRLDIPFIEKEEEYVLYVDIDVLFTQDVTLEDFELPRYLAAAPEFEKDVKRMDYFNAGILFLNVPNMRVKCSQILDMLAKGERNATGLFDQGYLNQVCFKDMTLLPLEYNWKPYWGKNNEAKIIHFHGMKPGGTVEESGFGMSDEAILHSLHNHVSDIDGYVFYFMYYFDLLERDGKEWISGFVARATRILHQHYSSVLNNKVSFSTYKRLNKLYFSHKLKKSKQRLKQLLKIR